MGASGLKPQITTIIPTFRRSKMLQRAIRSVLNQTYPNFRVCVYDNASGDETRSVVEEFAKTDARVVYHCHPENIGARRNFIYGAERVRTLFFSFLSDDDVLLPEFYATALAGFQRHPEAMVSATPTITVDCNGKAVRAPLLTWEPGLHRPPHGMMRMLKNGHPEWTGVLFRTELLERIGPPDPEVGNPFDLDFELRAAARFPVIVDLRPGALFLTHKNSAAVSSGPAVWFEGWGKVIRNVRADECLSHKMRSEAVRLVSRRLQGQLFRAGVGAVTSGHWTEADDVVRCLSHFGRPGARLLVLRLLEGACRRWPMPRHLMLASRSVFRRLEVQRTGGLQTRLASYVRYLGTMEAVPVHEYSPPVPGDSQTISNP